MKVKSEFRDGCSQKNKLLNMFTSRCQYGGNWEAQVVASKPESWDSLSFN